MKFKLTNSQDVVQIEKSDGSIIDLTNLRGGVVEGYYVNGNFYDMIIEHDYVEIGGIKWATMNLGAETVTDYGLYYQWGDTQGYTAAQCGSEEGQKYFGWTDYKYCDGTNSVMTKYNSTDGKTVLDANDDAATAAWGNGWRMPTAAEFVALGAAITDTWTDDYESSGVAGLVLTANTDSSKTLFFPAAGRCYSGSFYDGGSRGYYWSSSLYSSNVGGAYGMYSSPQSVYWQDGDDRFSGRSVRAIYDGPIPTPITPESETIYIDKNTNLIFIYNNEINRWVKLGNSNAALLGDPDGTAFSANFDPQTDTVWNKAQVLTSGQKAQVKENLGLQDIVFNTAYNPVNNKAATMDDIPQSLPANGGNAATVNNHSVQSDVPANAVFTDTTYSTATQSDAGLMSAADKTKLDNTKNITVSSSDPTSSDGEDGDIWFVYDAS